jgi:hypothetical protein
VSGIPDWVSAERGKSILPRRLRDERCWQIIGLRVYGGAMTTSSDSASTPTSDENQDEFDKTANLPDGSGTDASSGDEEQDTTSGGSPEDADK